MQSDIGLRSRSHFWGTKFFPGRCRKFSVPPAFKTSHFPSGLIPGHSRLATSRPVSVPKMKQEFPNLILVHFKTIQEFPEWYLVVPAHPKFFLKFSRATRPDISSLVTVSAIWEVPYSLVLSCPTKKGREQRPLQSDVTSQHLSRAKGPKTNFILLK